MRHTQSIALLLLTGALAAASGASAQDSAGRPLTLVVGAAPAGLTDLLARAIGPSLSRALKQPVVVSNRAGAGGAVGAAAVAQAAPDGNILLVAISSFATLPEQEIINNRPPLFRFSELAPVAGISTEPMMLVVRPDSPLRTLKDVIDAAKKRAGAVSYSSTGVYGTYHVAIEMLAHEAGIKLLAVHYKGGGDAMRALLGGEVEMSLVSRSVGIAQIRGGALRPVVSWSQQRWEQFPDVPSLKDEGFALGYDLVTGFFAPAATPAAQLQNLRNAVRAAVADSQFRGTMEKMSAQITYYDAPEFGALWERESARLNGVVRRIGRLE